MERRLAAILAADMFGYSQLIGNHEDKAKSACRRERDERSPRR